jgi:hypothetical protein
LAAGLLAAEGAVAYIISVFGCYDCRVQARGRNGDGGGLGAGHGLGEHVLVLRGAGLPAAVAEIVSHNFHRPHLVKVVYASSAAVPAEWIMRSQIAGGAVDDAGWVG